MAMPRASRTMSRLPFWLWIACVISSLPGAMLGREALRNLSSVSPSGCQLVPTNIGIKATCIHLGLRSVPQDLPSNTVVLYLSVNQITTLDNKSFTNLTNIVTLGLGKNIISLIENGTFEHLIHLRELILERNRLVSFPAGLLRSNRVLTKLILNGNKLNLFPSNILPWSNNINVIDLSKNNISFIKPSNFIPLQNCSSIHLYLSSNALKNLPSNIFSAVNKITVLSLSNNALSELHMSSFISNNDIDELSLKNCKIHDIIPMNHTHRHPNSSSKIVLINLSENRLRSLPDFSFWGLNETYTLLLKNNQITTLSHRSFCGIDQLVDLDLSCNHLTSLPFGVFSCNKMLQILKLAGNKIESWTIGLLSGLSSLHHLDLARNDIEDVKSSINVTILSLEYLDLSFNKFKGIKKYFLWGFTNLKILNMSHNELTALQSPYSFTKLQNIEELYLTNEGVQDLNGAFQYMGVLRILDLSFAVVKLQVKSEFTNNTSLLKLALRENELWSTDLFDMKTSKSLFFGLKSLVRLDLRGNHLNMIAPGTFKPLKSLKLLLLSQSSIKVLSPSVFQSLTSLITIDLRDNEISTIPGDILQSQHHLGVFYIMNNKLDSIPKTLFNGTPSLHSLYIQGNRITTIEPGTMFPTNRTIRLDVSGNPFSCTCDLAWFVKWLRSGSVELFHPDDTLCSLSSIKDLVHSPILAFHPDQYCGINILLVTSVSLSVVLVAILSLVGYRKRWWFNYKLFLLKLAIFGYEEINQDFDDQDYEYQLNLMYHEDDQGWVDQVMKPILQERFPHLQKVVFGDNNLNLEMFYINALHYAVENSFKTVLLLSNSSVDESWFMTKLRIALEDLNDTRLDKVILIFLEDIQDKDLPYLVRLFLSKNKPYMLWMDDEDGQELFWAQFEKSMRANRAINNVIPV